MYETFCCHSVTISVRDKDGLDVSLDQAVTHTMKKRAQGTQTRHPCHSGGARSTQRGPHRGRSFRHNERTSILARPMIRCWVNTKQGH